MRHVNSRGKLTCGGVGALMAMSLSTHITVADADVLISTNWQNNKGTLKANQLGLNIWAGMDPNIASNQNFKNGVSYIGPKIIRYHAGEQISPGSGRSWVDNNGNWVSTRIHSVLDNTNIGGERLVTITKWPAWMDSNNDGKLDSDKFANYADWCKQLVTICNGSGRYVKYWEPFNEIDGDYSGDPSTLATIFKQVRNKMREADSSIKVGALAAANPWGDSYKDGFLNGVGSEIDFFSYHHYGSGSTGTGINDLYNSTEGLASRASGIRNKLVSRGLNIPLFLDEHNMFDTWDKDTAGLMRSSGSAVWDALFLKYLVEGSDADGLFTWNDADYTYGKLDPSNNAYSARWSAHFMKLAKDHLIGDFVDVSTSDGNVRGFAVRNGTKFTLMFINRSGVSQLVDTSFANNWAPSSTGYTEHRVSANESGGYQSSSRTWSGAPQNISMPAHSVYVLVFTGNSIGGGQRPYGGSARNLPGRIQAEDYDHGGKFVAYFDDSYGNAGNVYRTDHVDIYGTADTGGGYKIGNTQGREYWRYTVNVPAGTYNIKLRAASHWGTGNGAITLKLSGSTLGSVGVPQTWNSDSFTDVNLNNVTVSSSSGGNGRTLEIYANWGGFDINWIEFASAGGPGPNLISNPSFDAENYDTQTPSGWSEWSDLGGVNASYTEGWGGTSSGARHGTHWMNSAYRVYTYQTKTGLTNGLYTARCKAKSGGGQTTAQFEVKDYGSSTRSVQIPVNSNYQTLEIKDINVTNGQATIGFWSVANAGNWAYFDDVEFFKQ
jgi:hypothetical protein